MDQDSASAKLAKKSGSSPGTPGTELQASGQDDYLENETAFSYSDMEFDDFEAQSEQLGGYDQEYIKLSTDPFRGRFVSAFFDWGVSLHYETVNCAMQQRLSCPEGVIGFGVSLAQPESAANGIKLGRDDVIITRPGSEFVVDVPRKGGIFLLLSFNLRTLEPLVGTDSILEHLDPDRRKLSVVRAACLASSLKAGGMATVEACDKNTRYMAPHVVASALATNSVAALCLDMRLDHVRERTSDKQSAAVFTAARDALSVLEEFDYTTLGAVTGNSPRSIQLAFAEHVQVPPRHYFRTIKLHRVRQALRSEPGAQSATIGDIAAAHGFWHWSRFTQLYRQQFGETPSETRARANGRPRPAGAA